MGKAAEKLHATRVLILELLKGIDEAPKDKLKEYIAGKGIEISRSHFDDCLRGMVLCEEIEMRKESRTRVYRLTRPTKSQYVNAAIEKMHELSEKESQAEETPDTKNDAPQELPTPVPMQEESHSASISNGQSVYECDSMPNGVPVYVTAYPVSYKEYLEKSEQERDGSMEEYDLAPPLPGSPVQAYPKGKPSSHDVHSQNLTGASPGESCHNRSFPSFVDYSSQIAEQTRLASEMQEQIQKAEEAIERWHQQEKMRQDEEKKKKTLDHLVANNQKRIQRIKELREELDRLEKMERLAETE